MTSNSKVSTASAKNVLSPELYARVVVELDNLCDNGCRLYFSATKGKHEWRGNRLTPEDIENITKRKAAGESAISIAESYQKSPSYIHRLIAKHREDKGNGQPNQEPAIQEVSSAES
jgi:hypothetical protein